MATRAQLPTIAPTKMRSGKRPYTTLPNTEEELLCANKRRLFHAFKQAGTRFVAEWLMSSPTQPFHHRTPVPPTAFDHALAINATQNTTPPCSGPGSDLLLVPVALHQGRLLGYSFGGLPKLSEGDSCPYAGPSYPFFPHFVGRFSFDVASGDFLSFIHGIKRRAIGVMHIRHDEGSRDRSMFVVGAGDYGYQRLPGRLLSLVTGLEKRKNTTPKYQFSVGGISDNRAMTDVLARLERLLKGDFECPKMRRDDMDPGSGEVLNRITMETDAKFDVMDAVGLQKARDQALRIYYSYMSGVSGGTSSGGTSSSST